jgi:hypothetical protein
MENSYTNVPYSGYYHNTWAEYGTPAWPLMGRPYPAIIEWGWFGEQLILKSPNDEIMFFEPTERPIHVVCKGLGVNSFLHYYDFSEIIADLKQEGLTHVIPFVEDVKAKCEPGEEYYLKANELREKRRANAQMKDDMQRALYLSDRPQKNLPHGK